MSRIEWLNARIIIAIAEVGLRQAQLTLMWSWTK